MLYKGQELRLSIVNVVPTPEILGLGVVVVNVLDKQLWAGQYLLEKVNSAACAAGIGVEWFLGNSHGSRNKSEFLNLKWCLRRIVLGNI